MKDVRGVILAEDEVMIREYEASYISNPKSEGYVIATNRRLIFTGSTSSAMGSSILVRDTKIDTITGVYGGLTNKKSLTQIIVGAIIALISLFFIFNEFSPIPVFIFLLGAFFAYKGLNASGIQMYLFVQSSQTSSSIGVAVEASQGWFSRIKGHDAVMTVSASGPGQHTEQMIKELSALIQDIQIMGDLAINRWSNQNIATNSVQTTQSTIEQLSTVVGAVKQTAVVATEAVAEASKKVKETKEAKTVASQQTKQCRCGNLNSIDADFCGECGTKLNQQLDNIFG